MSFINDGVDEIIESEERDTVGSNSNSLTSSLEIFKKIQKECKEKDEKLKKSQLEQLGHRNEEKSKKKKKSGEPSKNQPGVVAFFPSEKNKITVKKADKDLKPPSSLEIKETEEENFEEQLEDIAKNHVTRISSKNSGRDPVIQFSPSDITRWIYPTSKSFRSYQFEITETALFNNCLVCLPTGLGKTFISAVVILNYYLWFPRGKIFFLAPTRPLVRQQLEALLCVKGINQDSIVELTGHLPEKRRKIIYEDPGKRIFFMTPQTLDNDLEERRFDPTATVLVIFDEAHRATGNYAYTKIVRNLDKYSFGFRIVALSATPGNNFDQIQEVINNLQISKLEVKDDTDPDIKKYIHLREVVPLIIKGTDLIEHLKMRLNKILDYPWKVLLKLNAIPENIKGLFFACKGEVNYSLAFKLRQEINNKLDFYMMELGRDCLSRVFECLSVISSLVHARKVACEQGLVSFCKYINDFKDNLQNKKGTTIAVKKELVETKEFKELLESINNMAVIKQSHPKLEKLQEVLNDFFGDVENLKNESRVIIFTQSRASANEIQKFLENNNKITSAIFVGQTGKPGEIQKMTQKKQLDVLNRFRKNEINALIATCIGEEGLDIGEVDLIICYDSGFSPIRMIQRKGRTGRKRQGKVIFLLMAGKEETNYQLGQKRSSQLMKDLKQNSQISLNKNCRGLKRTNKNALNFYCFNPRMIPEDAVPKLFIGNNLEKEIYEPDEYIPYDESDDDDGETILFGTALEEFNQRKDGTEDSKNINGETLENSNFLDQTLEYGKMDTIFTNQSTFSAVNEEQSIGKSMSCNADANVDLPETLKRAESENNQMEIHENKKESFRKPRSKYVKKKKKNSEEKDEENFDFDSKDDIKMRDENEICEKENNKLEKENKEEKEEIPSYFFISPKKLSESKIETKTQEPEKLNELDGPDYLDALMKRMIEKQNKDSFDFNTTEPCPVISKPVVEEKKTLKKIAEPENLDSRNKQKDLISTKSRFIPLMIAPLEEKVEKATDSEESSKIKTKKPQQEKKTRKKPNSNSSDLQKDPKPKGRKKKDEKKSLEIGEPHQSEKEEKKSKISESEKVSEKKSSLNEDAYSAKNEVPLQTIPVGDDDEFSLDIDELLKEHQKSNFLLPREEKNERDENEVSLNRFEDTSKKDNDADFEDEIDIDIDKYMDEYLASKNGINENKVNKIQREEHIESENEFDEEEIEGILNATSNGVGLGSSVKRKFFDEEAKNSQVSTSTSKKVRKLVE